MHLTVFHAEFLSLSATGVICLPYISQWTRLGIVEDIVLVIMYKVEFWFL